MARHRELVNPSDFLYFIPQLPKHLHISCQRCGIAGYIHDAVRLHAGHGVEEVFFAAFSRRIDDDDIRRLPGGAEALGGLPAHKLHCSVLAEEAIKKALQDYFDRNGIPYDEKDFPACEHCAHCESV